MDRVLRSDESRDFVVDTVVLNYFLLADRQDLLIELLGKPIYVPRVVFDPDEEITVQPKAMSELSRGIDRYRRLGEDTSRPVEEQEEATSKSKQLSAIRRLVSSGEVVIVDMNEAERVTFASLMSPDNLGDFGLTFLLGAGEAACVSIALNRELALSTHDKDAIVALENLSPSHPVERVRGMLVRAANQQRVTEQDANLIHAQMRDSGFWDCDQPFPDK